MPPAPVLWTTERLFLRAGRDSDAAAVVAGLNDWSVAQWLLQPPFPYREQDATDFIARSADVPGVFPQIRFIAGRKDDGVVGCVTLRPDTPDDRGRRLELAYWVAAIRQGSGIAAEAARRMLEEASAAFGSTVTVFATTAPDNEPSRATLERIGFCLAAQGRRDQTNKRGEGRFLLFERTLSSIRL